MKFKKPTLKTSRRMKKVKGRGTKPEKIFASLLRKNGIKYQGQPKLFGKPDFRVKDTKILIFCDSSFWHGRRREEITGEAFRINRSFWREKLLYNKNKDKRVNRALRRRGWTVVRFWDDEILKHPDRVLKKLKKHVKTSK
jgi:DNA mismatch endonuclease (patch repair protein)